MNSFKIMLVFILVVSASLIAIPEQINYQGKLTDDSGVAIDSVCEITFSIYDAETGGSLLWTETHPSVDVSHGLFDVHLGSITSFPVTLDFSGDYWLEITVGAETLTPRQPLLTVPYSFRSKFADSVAAAGVIDHNDLGGLQGGAAGEYYHLTAAEYANLHAPGSDNQNLFESITDGTNTYTAATETDQITFTGVGGASVLVNPGTGEVRIDASGAGDDWGSQFVETDASLTGDGRTGTELGIADDGVQDNHIDWGNLAGQVDATDVLYFSGHDWNWIDPDPDDVGEGLDSLASKVESIVAGGGEPNQTITTGDGCTGAEGGTTGDFTIDIGAGTGISVDATTVSADETWFDGQYIELTDNLNGDVVGAYDANQIASGVIVEDDLDATNLPTAGYVLSYDAGGGFTWIPDNTGSDDQTLSLVGNQLSIEDGNTVTFTGWDTDASDDVNVGDNISLLTNDAGYITSPDDADADPTNEIQTLVATASAGGALVDISGSASDVDLVGGGFTTVSRTGANEITIISTGDGTGSDDQTLSLVGNQLSIEDGNTVTF
ncbi:hypothetical protein DRQ36_11180, partial [bacterium]